MATGWFVSRIWDYLTSGSNVTLIDNGNTVAIKSTTVYPVRGYANLNPLFNAFFTWDCSTCWQNVAESAAQIPIPAAGTCLALRVKCSFNSGINPSVFTVKKNGVSTGMTVTVTAGSTLEFKDEAHSFSFNAGDLITVERLAPMGTGTIDANVSLLYNF